MAPAYKLTYFDARGLGEPIRILFTYGEIEFEDIRIKRADFPAIKENYPFGQLPVLEYNGKVSHQSSCIARYVAKQVKLAGNNDWEDLEIDAIVDTLKDFSLQMRPFFFEQDQTKKNELKKEVDKKTVYFMDRFNTSCKNNGGYLAIGRLTWADITFFTVVDMYNQVISSDGEDVLANYPELIALREKISNDPKVKVWLDKRPKVNVV